MLNIISWGVFRMREDPEIVTISTLSNSSSGGGGGGGGGGSGGGGGRGGGGGSRRLSENYSEETFLRAPELYVGAERYSERLEFIAGILLACVAFQYMIGESIPKLGILTTMDWLLMSSYITLFAMSLETFVVHHYSLDGSQYGRRLDWYGGILVPLLYLLMQSFHILNAVCMRRVRLTKLSKQVGVAPNMLRKNVVSAERIKNHGAAKKANTKFESGTSMKTETALSEEQLELQTVGELCFGLTTFGDNDVSDDGDSGVEASSSKYTVSADDDGAEMA